LELVQAGSLREEKNSIIRAGQKKFKERDSGYTVNRLEKRIKEIQDKLNWLTRGVSGFFGNIIVD